MAKDCCHVPDSAAPDAAYRKILWWALLVNFLMFFVEITAAYVGNSTALFADSIDFAGDAANYGISLFVLSMHITTRAKAALFKALCMGAFGMWVLTDAAYQAYHGIIPNADVMGWVGFVALVANVSVALMLYRYRDGDSNMRSVWLCTRNDAIGNLLVLFAAVGVFFLQSVWPDVVVAVIMATLGLSSAVSVIRHSRKELATHRDKE